MNKDGMNKDGMNKDGMNTDVIKAVQELYHVFGKYPVNWHTVNACVECCMSKELADELRRLPLCQLGQLHLYEYNSAAYITDENPAEVKYLLPRMAELLVEGKELHHSLEIYFQRVGRCIYAFNDIEKQSWQTFANVFIKAVLTKYPWQTHQDMFDYVLMFTIGGVDISPLLEIWLNTDTPQATIHYIYSGYDEYWHGGKIDNSFASDNANYDNKVSEWIEDKHHRQIFAKRIVCLDKKVIDEFSQWAKNHLYGGDFIIDWVFDGVSK